ncbi:MAG: WecB/TagA/CpsF family glycosyltransferase, partial [Bacteroidota bacterium]|nr:WecB/TagA/CpsF family glycosyltransferase [Bacteroidota bacterium]
MQSGTTQREGQGGYAGGTGSVFVFGVRLDLLLMEDVLDRIGRAIDSGEPLTITGPHFSILLQAYQDPNLRAFLNGCSINHPDGVGTALAVRFLHGIRCVRLNGTDLYQRILRQYPLNRYRYFFLGGDETTVRCLRESFSRMGYN